MKMYSKTMNKSRDNEYIVAMYRYGDSIIKYIVKRDNREMYNGTDPVQATATYERLVNNYQE